MAERPVFYERKRTVAGVFVFAILIAASQWYLYELIRGHAVRFGYYLITCSYLCGVLTPAVLWFGRRWPISANRWKASLPVHLVASILLTSLGVLVEATAVWLPAARSWPYAEAIRHYFKYQTQISLLTYWAILGGFHIYRLWDQARMRELHAARLEAQLSEAQLFALRTQLQPHFLFNTLQAAIMLIHKDPQGAEEILLSLSELLRISFQALQQQEVPLCQEIDFVKHYSSIQQRRFGDRLRFLFQIEEQTRSAAVPSLFLQPLVENAVRHGIGMRSQPDVISIRTCIKHEKLNIEIENRASVLNGEPEQLVSRGLGLANTIARLERLYGLQQSFTIRNIEPCGVLVSLSIPLRPLGQQTASELEAQVVS